MQWNVSNYAHWECNKAVIAKRGSDGFTVSRVACFFTKTAVRMDGFHELCGISFICGSKIFEWKVQYKDKIFMGICSAICKSWFFVCFLLYLGCVCTIFICLSGIQICRRWLLKLYNTVHVDIISLALDVFIFC